MAGTEVYQLPNQSEKCWPQNVRYQKYKDHETPKYGIKKGGGRDLGWVICPACADGPQKRAIGREVTHQAELTRAAQAAEAERKRRGPFRRYWAWGAVAIAGVALIYGGWLVAAAFAVVALVRFLAFAPLPCRATSDAEDCEELTGGLLVACENKKHRERHLDLLGNALRDRQWPQRVWDMRIHRFAVAGVFTSGAIVLLSGAYYGLTVLF